MGYSIKTISQKSGLSQYTLRYYEREGVLPVVARMRTETVVFTMRIWS